MVILLTVGFAVGCAEQSTTAPATSTDLEPPIQASLLIQTSDTDILWYRAVEGPIGMSAYDLTLRAIGPALESKWSPAFQSHFVEGIAGVQNDAPYYWIVYVWDDQEGTWTPLTVGPDIFSITDGSNIAWAYTNTSQQSNTGPTAVP